ncbi:MAG: MerR family transcriptional regulator [Treponema sp.]|nr:MerR family transcriptional regulator [Treponema sp.]
MTIKEASEKTGISIDNLRYYERIGLIPEVPRSAGGIRDYDADTMHWIDFAMRFKKSGLSLEAIREYIQLAIKGEATKPARKEVLLEAKADLEAHRDQIQESLDMVNYKLAHWEEKCEPLTQELVREWKKNNPEF